MLLFSSRSVTDLFIEGSIVLPVCLMKHFNKITAVPWD